jgi:hypothetical protein
LRDGLSPLFERWAGGRVVAAELLFEPTQARLRVVDLDGQVADVSGGATVGLRVGGLERPALRSAESGQVVEPVFGALSSLFGLV